MNHKGGLIGIVSPDGEVVYHENINGNFQFQIQPHLYQHSSFENMEYNKKKNELK